MQQSPPQSDKELLDAWRLGDEGAGNELCRRHFRSVYTFFRTKVDYGHRDLVQRTFLGCVESRDRVPEGTPFRAYLLGIAHHQLHRAFRKQDRENRAMRRAAGSEPESSRTPSRVIAERREHRVLLRGLRALPMNLQIVVELYYWEELRVADIALITGVVVGTVKSRLARARERLQDYIRRSLRDAALVQSTIDGLDQWALSLRAVVERAHANADVHEHRYEQGNSHG